MRLENFTTTNSPIIYHLQSNDERKDKHAKRVLNRESFMEEEPQESQNETDSDIEESESD
jgi:hypothetical protein